VQITCTNQNRFQLQEKGIIASPSNEDHLYRGSEAILESLNHLFTSPLRLLMSTSNRKQILLQRTKAKEIDKTGLSIVHISSQICKCLEFFSIDHSFGFLDVQICKCLEFLALTIHLDFLMLHWTSLLM